ncbi:MAG: efflux RND transporter periplasmic adaptor subunit [Acidobacteria bacterium]|nr:MAG: efflux RND transporter periplasmic adaptor subunit [Acidobacteriota bacterium]
MLKLKPIVLSMGLLLLSNCKAKPEAEPEPVVTVDVAPVLSSAIQLKVKADAVLYPLQQAAIVPKITAPIKKFYVEKGSTVRAGQLLAELENQDLAGTVAEAKAAYDQAEAAYQTTARATVPEDLRKSELDVQTTKETMDAQQKVYQGRQTLFKEGAIAQKDVNDALVAFTQARNQYELARTHLQALQAISQDQTLKGAAAQRDAAKARYESAQAQLAYSRITSPISGVVTDRPLFAGEMPAGGGPIITVMDVSQIVARAHVSQDEAKSLKVGDPARFIPADGGAPIPGKVTIVSPALDPTSTTVEVWVQAANVGSRLKPGSSLRVETIAQSVPNALIIPEAAVLTSTSGSTSVMVATADNKPQKKSVTLGIHDNGNVQVTEGLVSGERVVTTGAFELNKLDPEVLAKTKLQIQPPKEEEEEDEK